jgi:hypothetical protein
MMGSASPRTFEGAMGRRVVITALLVLASACAAGESNSTSQGQPPVADSPAVETTVAPTTRVVPADVGVTDVVVSRLIAMPAPSGDPELDALGAELEGLSEQLAALDSAVDDLQGTP